MKQKQELFFCALVCSAALFNCLVPKPLEAAYSSSFSPPVYSQEEQAPTRHATGREDIAYVDERDRDIHHRADRKGDWDYKQNWRYDRKAFYGGETQGEAYEEEHPEGQGGPGMDADQSYLKMREYYLRESQRREPQSLPNQAAPVGRKIE